MGLLTACAGKSTSDAPGGGGTGGGGKSGSGGGTGGSSDGEYIDEDGRCRRAFEDRIFGCPGSYDQASALPTPCGAACAGRTGDYQIFMNNCTPTRGCAYDFTTGNLVGAYRGDDVAQNCDGTSFRVVAGEFPAELRLNRFDRDENCAGVQEENLAPLFNEIFGAEPVATESSPCRSGRDDCRGPVRMFVCANAAGEIAGDGACRRCSTDAECQAEYGYAGDGVVCSSTGLCDIQGVHPGVCVAEVPAACRTADGAYACRAGLCDRCKSAEECEATSPGELDVCQAGQCLRSERPPP